MTWSIEDMPSQKGKTIVITGANSGLGFEAAKALAAKGAEVVLTVRTLSKGEDAVQQIRAAHPTATVHAMELNLADLSSVAAFTDAFKVRFNRLDVLMNNAGVMATPETKTADGFELQFGTNHLGHFALTGQLLDVLLATPNSRVVNISSVSAENGKMHFDDVMFKQGYRRFDAYGQSKLANLLFTLGLERHFEAIDTDSIAVAAHPGIANTQLSRGMIRNNLIRSVVTWILGFFLASLPPDVAAKAQVRAAIDPSVKGGDYYGPGKGDPVKVPMPDSVREEDIQKLWELSEQLTNVYYSGKTSTA